MSARIPLLRRAAKKPTAIEEVAPTFEKPLRTLVDRGVAVQFIYGTEDGFYTDEYLTAAAGSLADVLDESRGAVHLSVLPGQLHGFTSVVIQDAVIDEIVGWVAAHRPADEPVVADEAT
jgi:hypothetical protein